MELFENGMLPEDICDILGVSKSSFHHWRENLDVYGDVVPDHNPIQGRPRTLDPHQVHDLLESVQQVPEMYLDEIQDWLAVTHDIALSLSVIHQLLQDAGLSYKMLCKAAAEHDDVRREEFRSWAAENLVASMIVTADESSKDDRTIFRHWG
jgi:transposase